MFGFDLFQSLLIATALTATSVAISIQVLSEFGKIKSAEARLIICAAVIDDILAIAILSVVTSLGGDVTHVDVLDVTFTVLKILGFFRTVNVTSRTSTCV